MTSALHDFFGVIATRPPQRVLFGSVDVVNAMRGGRIHGSLESRGELELTLDVDALPPDPVDYLAPLRYHSRGGAPRFAGHVATGVPNGRRITCAAFGATLLTEQAVGTFVAFEVPHPELIYVMARASGMTDDQLHIGGLDELAPEVFEVLTPVHGVTVRDSTPLGSVTFLPQQPTREHLAELGFDKHVDQLDGDAFALCPATAVLGYHAEQAALETIDVTLSWIAARLRHATAVLPDGSLQTFDRAKRRAVPRRGELVVIRGLASGRRWLRSANGEATAASATLDPGDPLLQNMPTALRPVERLALSACLRAIAETEPLARIQAISETIECLVGGVKVPAQWSAEHLNTIRDALPDHLPADLRERARKAISDLNEVPLMPRLRHLVDARGLTVSDTELELLTTVRRIRNDAVHGREAEPPAPEMLDYATAVISRLTVEQLATR